MLSPTDRLNELIRLYATEMIACLVGKAVGSPKAMSRD